MLTNGRTPKLGSARRAAPRSTHGAHRHSARRQPINLNKDPLGRPLPSLI
ncbi:hypothetical protein BURPS1106B_2896 [Burkholderia pseudomallei 1106b]|uniref:Uncharacterized protein n=1 Tax=Burkholderia pseudomallei (strain 1106a) TaxID=357348 RepID=A3P7K7_BURP0|nr:hypothetical protein BURPS1106A_A2284 [Burkholderia pseudomallei 1106a]EEH28238.1 conserved hypothetical protein [Burkholderia pseudomallei Pakistan 9]EES21631.1 hypothetical protein BURPS1106B_2896 [Burkholderia pseudomallei 1106b]